MALPPQVNTKQDEIVNCATTNATILELPDTARAFTSKRKRGNEDRSHEMSGEKAPPKKKRAQTGTKVFPCPLAHKFGCIDMFTTKRGAISHSNRHSHLIPYPCPYAEKLGYNKTFDLEENAKYHGKHYFRPHIVAHMPTMGATGCSTGPPMLRNMGGRTSPKSVRPKRTVVHAQTNSGAT